jgi:hypothetical protein
VRTCEHCGRSIEHKRRDARHCDGPCRAAASRGRASERSNSVAPAPDPGVLDQSAQKRTGHASDGAEWQLATPAEEALLERITREYADLWGDAA